MEEHMADDDKPLLQPRSSQLTEEKAAIARGPIRKTRTTLRPRAVGGHGDPSPAYLAQLLSEANSEGGGPDAARRYARLVREAYAADAPGEEVTEARGGDDGPGTDPQARPAPG
jgi:hypothetical protein